MKFRKKPMEIEAIQWDGTNYKEICQFTRIRLGHTKITYSTGDVIECLVIPTLEGEHRASIGDWIIKGVVGEFYPCKPDIFQQTYELVEG